MLPRAGSHGFPLPISNWRIGEKIGAGAYGEVHKAINADTGSIFAVIFVVFSFERINERYDYSFHILVVYQINSYKKKTLNGNLAYLAPARKNVKAVNVR